MPQILLVEDNELNRDMLRRRLERRGYQVLVAVSGGEALKYAGTEIPDLILMDMGLPDIDGWEVASRIREEPRTQAIPIIALTAHAMAGDREMALAAGCDDYVTKPIELTLLLEKMEFLIEEHGRSE